MTRNTLFVRYLIATISLPVIGILIIGFAFSYMFTGGGSSISLIFSLVVALACPAVLSYNAAKRFGLAWWYPSMLITTPGIAWFVAELTYPNSHPYILLVPITAYLAIGLVAGKIGHRQRNRQE